MKDSEKDEILMKFIKREVTVGEVLMTLSMILAAIIWLIEGRLVGQQNTDAIMRESIQRREDIARVQAQVDKLIDTSTRLTENQNLVAQTLARMEQWRLDHDKPIPH